MAYVPILYATSEGQTRRIAERIAQVLRDEGVESAAFDVRSRAAERLAWDQVDAVVLGASLHMAHHQRDARRFARKHRRELNGRPSAFFSVSLTAASDELEDVETVQGIARKFTQACDWHPERVVCFPGSLAYTRYGPITRFVMKRIAKSYGGPTDTSRDHELTDWEEIDRFARELAESVLSGERLAASV